MRRLKEEALALAGTFVAVLVGSLAFVTLTMPFVFPFAAAVAIGLVWRYQARLKAVTRSPAAGRTKPAGRRGSRSLYPV